MSEHSIHTHPNNTGNLKVVVTIDTGARGWELLAPGGSIGKHPIIDGCEFLLNPEQPTEADFWIVFANARPHDIVMCAPANTLFIAGEPEEKKIYPKAFYRQFGHIVDTHAKSGHPGLVLHASCLSWHIGLGHASCCYEISHAQLSAMACPNEVANKISVVCSNAAFTPGQRQRLAFLAELKELLGDQLVHFGRGFQPVDDKLEAIHGFRFHLVMENCRTPHYWTEKLSDTYLGWAFPLYIGCPNLSDYFPEPSYQDLDIQQPEQAAATIRKLLATPRDEHERKAVAIGRDLILNRYNPWVIWASWAKKFHQPDARPEKTQIRSHRAFRPFPRGLLYRLKTR